MEKFLRPTLTQNSGSSPQTVLPSAPSLGTAPQGLCFSGLPESLAWKSLRWRSGLGDDRWLDRWRIDAGEEGEEGPWQHSWGAGLHLSPQSHGWAPPSLHGKPGIWHHQAYVESHQTPQLSTCSWKAVGLWVARPRGLTEEATNTPEVLSRSRASLGVSFPRRKAWRSTDSYHHIFKLPASEGNDHPDLKSDLKSWSLRTSVGSPNTDL